MAAAVSVSVGRYTEMMGDFRGQTPAEGRTGGTCPAGQTVQRPLCVRTIRSRLLVRLAVVCTCEPVSPDAEV